METRTVSFCILDDLSPAYGPKSETVELEGNFANNVQAAVHKLILDFIAEDNDPTGYYVNEIDESAIVADLLSDKFYVINRYEKYYVIAFALDFTRFEVYSKDCSKELIKWRSTDANDPVAGLITDGDYNMNPVIKLMQQHFEKY